MKWFSNKGQVAQLAVAVVGVAFSGVRAWPDLKHLELLTVGAMNFYLLLALLCLVGVNLYRLVSGYRPVTTEVNPKNDSVNVGEIVKSVVVSLDPPTNNPQITYKTKLRCVFTNVAKETINVERAAWITTKDGAGTQTPFPALYQVERNLGSWKNGEWNKQELDEIQVEPGWSFRIWIGLDQTASRDWLDRRKNTNQLGTLLMPISHRGQAL